MRRTYSYYRKRPAHLSITPKPREEVVTLIATLTKAFSYIETKGGQKDVNDLHDIFRHDYGEACAYALMNVDRMNLMSEPIKTDDKYIVLKEMLFETQNMISVHEIFAVLEHLLKYKLPEREDAHQFSIIYRSMVKYEDLKNVKVRPRLQRFIAKAHGVDVLTKSNDDDGLIDACIRAVFEGNLNPVYQNMIKPYLREGKPIVRLNRLKGSTRVDDDYLSYLRITNKNYHEYEDDIKCMCESYLHSVPLSFTNHIQIKPFVELFNKIKKTFLSLPPPNSTNSRKRSTTFITMLRHVRLHVETDREKLGITDDELFDLFIHMLQFNYRKGEILSVANRMKLKSVVDIYKV